MTVQDAFLTQLDSIWAPKRVPRGAQDEPKTDPRRVQNRVQNRVEKMIEKWTAQGSMAGIGNGHKGPQVPTGGVGGESSKQPEDQYPRSSTPMGFAPLRPANFYCCTMSSSKTCLFIFPRSWRFRKVREAGRNHFHIYSDTSPMLWYRVAAKSPGGTVLTVNGVVLRALFGRY